jgi:hypothetical protein
VDLRENAFAACAEMLGHYPNSLLQFNQQTPTLQDTATRRMKDIRDMDKDEREQFEEELKVCLTIIMRCKKSLFHPTYEFQVVDPSLIIPGGLEVNMSFEEGQNKARISEAWKFSTKVQWSDGKSDFVIVPVTRHMQVLEVRQLFSEKCCAPLDKITIRATVSLDMMSDTDTVEGVDLFNLGAAVSVSGNSSSYFNKHTSSSESESIFEANKGTDAMASVSSSKPESTSAARGLRMSYMTKGTNELMLIDNNNNK